MERIDPQHLDEFTKSYIAAMLWGTNDDNGQPLDRNYSIQDIAPESMEKIIADCERFQSENASDIATWNNTLYTADEMAGHDFFLTRNHHGAGFWDGVWEKETGKRLTDAAHAFGQMDAYIGDDGMIYV
jgi:hypothetical protein